MKKWKVILVSILVAVPLLVIASPVASCVDGFTPGYWKNERQHAWTDYSPTDRFCDVFGVPAAQLPSRYGSDPTLMDVLRQGGGGLYAFSRQAVAQLLNVTHLGGDAQPGHEAWIKELVVKAFNNPDEITHSDNDFNMHTEDVEWWKDYIESYHD
jgi:hypothetical protein